MKKKCPFCLPNVKSAVFAKSENFLAVYNIAPILPGHCLLVPIEHVTGFLKIEDELMYEMVTFSRKIIQLLIEEFHAEGFDFTIQDGSSAGQTIDHMHAHIIPRKTNDMHKPGDWYPALIENNLKLLDSDQRPKINSEQLKTIVRHLSEKYNSFIFDK